MEADEGEVVEAAFALVTQVEDAVDSTPDGDANDTTSLAAPVSELGTEEDITAAAIGIKLDVAGAALGTELDVARAPTDFLACDLVDLTFVS